MKKLNFRGTDAFFSPSFEKGVYIYSLITSIVYFVFEIFVAKIFAGNSFFSYLLLLFPPATSLILSAIVLIKKNTFKKIFVWQVWGLTIFTCGHFFPYSKEIIIPGFQYGVGLLLLLFVFILYLPFIIAQTLILFSLKNIPVLKKPESGSLYTLRTKYLRYRFFAFILLPFFMIISSIITQNMLTFFLFFLMLFFSLSDMYHDSVRKICLNEEGLLFYSANKVIVLPFKDIDRLSLQKGFINVKKVLGLNGFTNKAHNYFGFTINQQISGYKELIPAIINKCDHLDASFTAKLLKDFQEGNANQK